MDLKAASMITSSPDDSPKWQKILERIVTSTVAIKFSTVRHFDTERAGYGVATGFVVDKQRGLILTNRHVVRPGPVTAEATFLDHEEVSLYPVYRDPVHDFGFYRFNPEEVKYMDITEISLAPNDAKVGNEIRIIGNDAGEKLSILSGTLARLDRPAPSYGEDKYNDFNTFYYQAASGTSGGSSGSPVIDINGKAIALVAGGKKKAASSFYLPLHKPLRALQYLQRGLPVPRGTIQTIFRHCPYDEVHRLGLKPSTEAVVRSTVVGETGMLVVDQVVPGGPAFNLLEPGDIVVKINGDMVTTFNDLESLLDSNVDTDISFEIERGGTPMSLTVKGQDLHSITPDKYLEIGGGILHPLSYQQAKNFRLPVGSVYVASEGYMFGGGGIQRGSIITAIGQTSTPNIQALEKVMSQLPDRSRIPVRYFCMNDRHSERLAVIRVDRCWHAMQMWTRDDVTGIWNCVDSPQSVVPRHTQKPATASPVVATGIAAKVVPSLVMVNFTVPFVVDGGSNDTFIGAGVIVDEKAGLVLVDQNTVPLSLGDLTITFGATAEIPGEVVFLHPVHNFGILKYDPSLLINSNFPAATISKVPLAQGDDVLFVGLSRKFQPLWQTTNISRIEELFIAEPRPPRFRAVNEEVIHLEKPPSCVGGVLVDNQGHVQSFWASYSSSDRKDPNTPVEFFRGFTSDLVEETLEQLRKGEHPSVRSLEAELWPISLSQARDVGLSEEWLSKIQEQSTRRHILNIRRLVANTDASMKLKTGDLLLAVDDKICTTFREVEIATKDAEQVKLTLLRNMEEVEETVSTVLLTGRGTTKIACWAGAILQDTHRPVAQLGFLHEGVYCSRWYFGSPAHKYSLRAAHWIVEVNGKATPNLATFLEVVSSLDVNEFVRLKIKGQQDRVSVTTLKLDVHYWPTWVLNKKGSDWVLEESVQHTRPQQQ
jgi:S1-C subfamily serine protease